MSVSLRRAGLALGGTLAALVASTPPALAISGGFNPSTTPPRYPGTSTTVDVWKLVGTHDFAAQNGASLTVVAGRWVIASGHAGLARSQGFRSALGATSRVLDYAKPEIPGVFDSAGKPVAAADISVSLLETPVPTPASGFPKLVADMGPTTLADSLPGYVLWAGQGGYASWPVPQAQWTLPYGEPAPGASPIEHIPGDSGSAGFYFPSATSAPLMTGIVDRGERRKPLGIGPLPAHDTVFSEPLGTTTDGTFATVADWVKAMFARHPEATPPTWTTLAAEGLAPSTLPPAAPANVRITTVSSQAVGLSWSHPLASGAPRSGYRVTVSPTPASGKSVYDVGEKLGQVISGLTTGVSYTFTVQAVGPHGVSVIKPNSRVTYLTRNTPSAPRDVRITGQRTSDKLGRITYCAQLSWLAASTDAGTTITQYDSTIDGTSSTEPTGLGATLGTDGRYSVVRCGYDAARSVTGTVRATSDLSRGATASASGSTPAGAPAGTAFPHMSSVAATGRRAIRSGKAEYCIRTTWNAPTPPAGFALSPIDPIVWTTDEGDYLVPEQPLGALATSYDQCGLAPATSYVVKLSQPYRALPEVGPNFGATAVGEANAATPDGAPKGTAVPAAAIATASGAVGAQGGTPSLCADVTWQAPAEIAGFPISGYQVALTGGSPSGTKTSSVLTAQARSVRLCGLNAGTHTAYLFTKYAVGAVPPATRTLNVP